MDMLFASVLAFSSPKEVDWRAPIVRAFNERSLRPRVLRARRAVPWSFLIREFTSQLGGEAGLEKRR